MPKQSFSSGLRAMITTAVLLTAACAAETDSGTAGMDGTDEAVEIWTYPDTVGVRVYSPLDLKSASRDVVWGVDRISGAVIRYEGLKGTSGVIGFQDNPPEQIVSPARLAVGELEGIFVFDDSTGMVDLYSPGGQHLRGFDPGLRPSILEISHQPLRLTYGVRTFDTDSMPTLSVIQTDFRGADPDTLLSADTGPESLRDAPAVRTRLISTPASSGLWIFAAAITDTVFEVAGPGPSRKLALPESDTLRTGILADLQQQVLWVAMPKPEGGLYYEAYDISDESEIIDGSLAYLGVRTTPEFFIPTSSFDGTVAGWWRSDNGVHTPRAYDMRIEALREGATAAREGRSARRQEFTRDWELAIQQFQEAVDERQREMEALSEEEALE